MSIKTDKTLIDKFLTRGVEKVLPDVDGLRAKLMSGERLTAYMGFDPTGPHLHIGHAMGIRSLAILQQLGHRVVFLVGDYTALVGDPDKGSTRELLTEEKIAANMAGWREQAGLLIDFEDKDNPVEFAGNHQWLSQLKLIDIIGLMSKMTVQQMLERELFQKRIAENKPLQLQELIYPLMQGYDSVAMKVDLELGGTDQIFNMMVGRDLVKSYLGKEKFVRAHRLMPAPDALTMSKSKGNGINLADSAQDMYGKAMSYADEHILEGLELLTETTEEELAEIGAAIERGENPMQYKKLLAFRIVELVRGQDAASQAEKHFQDTVQNRQVSQERTKISLKLMMPALIRSGEITDAVSIVSILQESSKGSAKQLLKQGGVEVNGQKCRLDDSIELAIGDIIKIGKRNWFEIVE